MTFSCLPTPVALPSGGGLNSSWYCSSPWMASVEKLAKRAITRMTRTQRVRYATCSAFVRCKTHKPSKGALMSFPASVFVVWVNKSCSLCDWPFLAQAVATGLCRQSSGQPLCQIYLKMCNYQKTTMPNTLSATSGLSWLLQTKPNNSYKGESPISASGLSWLLWTKSNNTLL